MPKSLKNNRKKRTLKKTKREKNTRKGGMDILLKSVKFLFLNKEPQLTREQQLEAESWGNSLGAETKGIKFHERSLTTPDERDTEAEEYIKFQQELMERKKMLEEKRKQINEEMKSIRKIIEIVKRENEQMAKEDKRV